MRMAQLASRITIKLASLTQSNCYPLQWYCTFFISLQFNKLLFTCLWFNQCCTLGTRLVIQQSPMLVDQPI